MPYYTEPPFSGKKIKDVTMYELSPYNGSSKCRFGA